MKRTTSAGRKIAETRNWERGTCLLTLRHLRLYVTPYQFDRVFCTRHMLFWTYGSEADSCLVSCIVIIVYLRQRRRYICDCPRCLSVCLCARLLNKTRALIWMKCCVSTDVGTWTNWLTFESDPDHSPDAGTGFLSPMAYALQRGNVEFYYVGKIPCTYWYWGPVEAATRGFEASKHRCRR